MTNNVFNFQKLAKKIKSNHKIIIYKAWSPVPMHDNPFFKKFKKSVLVNTNYIKDRIFFIPFNLSLDMDGLSGMRNYERFSITEDILPYSYRSSDAENGGVIDFIIKGISHNISNNQWKTKIESQTISSIRKPKTRS